MHTPRFPLIVAAFLLITIHAPTVAQSAQIAAAFDESGTQRCTAAVPGELNVYVVAYGISEISGYEFELRPTLFPSYFLGKILYGIAPLDFGEQYEVRAGTGGCVGYPTMMGPSPDSWALTRYDLLYFYSPSDMFFCVDASPSSGVDTPQYTLCDEDATKAPLELYTYRYDQYDGCAVANPTFDRLECLIVSAEVPSWGALKAQFHQ